MPLYLLSPHQIYLVSGIYDRSQAITKEARKGLKYNGMKTWQNVWEQLTLMYPLMF